MLLRSSQNLNNTKPYKNKKVNFQININNNNSRFKLKNIYINQENNDINFNDKIKKSKNKISKINDKNKKKELSYPDIRYIHNLKKNNSLFFLNNNIINIKFISNKSISDNERTTISSLNE